MYLVVVVIHTLSVHFVRLGSWFAKRIVHHKMVSSTPASVRGGLFSSKIDILLNSAS